MSKHPWDWIIHAILCGIPIVFGWASWFVVVFVAIAIEYEQKPQVWYNSLSWSEYFFKHAFMDLIADGLGIALGFAARGLIIIVI